MPVTSISQLVTDWSTPANMHMIHWRLFGTANIGGGYTISDNQWHSKWQVDGSCKTPGAVPTTVVAPTSATDGAFEYRDAATGTNYLTSFYAHSVAETNQISYLLYDRLLHIGGLDGTVTTAQTVGGTITRNTGGVGNQIWIEHWTDVGSTETTLTASYTNQAGTSGRTTQALPFGRTSIGDYMCQPLILQAGDTGVQSVESVTLAATTGTAGDFGVKIIRPLARTNPYTSGNIHSPNLDADWNKLNNGQGPLALEDGTCMCLMEYSIGTGEIESSGHIEIVEVA